MTCSHGTSSRQADNQVPSNRRLRFNTARQRNKRCHTDHDLEIAVHSNGFLILDIPWDLRLLNPEDHVVRCV